MNESIEQIPSGREKLKGMEAEGKYVFHGSENPDIDILEPRQAYTRDKKGIKIEDGEPAIFASSLADYAIFMALINKKNCPGGFNSTVGYRRANGEIKLELSVDQRGIEQLDSNVSGYVYVFDKNVFQPKNDRNVEYVSTVPVSSAVKITVTKSDLPPNIDITN